MKKTIKIFLLLILFTIILNPINVKANYYYDFTNSNGDSIQLVLSDYLINNNFKFAILETTNHYYLYYSNDTFKIKLDDYTTIKTDNNEGFFYDLKLKSEVENYILNFENINSDNVGSIDIDGYMENMITSEIDFSNFTIYDLDTGLEIYPNPGEETEGNLLQQILSFLNPFSDQFFGKKLAEFIIEGLKTLFIPTEGFFEDYFESLKEFFSGRFGFLEYPITFFTNFVDRIRNLGNSGNNTIINIPEIKVPVFDLPLIPATTYDLGHLYYDETLTNFYLLYQTILKGIIYFALIRLFMKKYNEVVQR